MTEDKDLAQDKEYIRSCIRLFDDLEQKYGKKELCLNCDKGNEDADCSCFDHRDPIVAKENIDRAIREERRRLLNDPRIKEIQSYLDAWATFSNGEPEAKRLLANFESLLKENE